VAIRVFLKELVCSVPNQQAWAWVHPDVDSGDRPSLAPDTDHLCEVRPGEGFFSGPTRSSRHTAPMWRSVRSARDQRCGSNPVNSGVLYSSSSQMLHVRYGTPSSVRRVSQ
jgi:hypothetical protein